MNGNFHNSRGSSRHNGNRNPRWRIVFIALVLVLAIGSVGPASTAQAAPARSGVTFYMDIVNPKTTVCVGDIVTYEAHVYMRYHPPLITPKGNELRQTALSGIKLEAFSQDKKVGDFTKTKKGFQTRNTGSGEDLVSLVTPNAAPGPHSAIFEFKAKKAGKTILRFEGLAGGQYVSFNVPVKVVNCKYKVQINSKWFAGMTSVATINNAVITADESGFFAGSFDVQWATSSLCGLKSPIATSKGDITGRINEDGMLALKITYGSASSSGGGSCHISMTTANFATPDPLFIKVPQSGVYREAQDVKAQNGSVTGRTIITVIPLEK